MRRNATIVAILVLSVIRCAKEQTLQPAPSGTVQEAAAVTPPAPPSHPAATEPESSPRTEDGALPASLQSKIDEYKGLMNRGEYAQGIEKVRDFIPEIQSFVDDHPTNAEAQLELAAGYSSAMIVTAQKLPPGDPLILQVLLEGVQNDYIGKARRALREFERYADPSDNRLKAAERMRQWLDELDEKMKRR